MLRKIATLEVLEHWQVPQGPAALQKLAHRVDFEYTPRPGFLYVRSRAISSRANDNHDQFPAEEIEQSYRSFLGKPVFVNHHNANHRRARGVIVAVALHRDKHPDGKPDTWAEVLMEVDAVRFPKLAKAILAGRVNRTSMGVDVEESQCTACGNKATDPAQYCKHLPAMKGRKIRQRDQKTGQLKEEIIREICRGLSFFENSLLVEEPADPTAFILGQPDARGMSDHMSPRQASLDVTDSLGMDAEEGSYRSDGLSLSQQGLDGSDIGFRQPARRIRAARQTSPSGDHLGRVRGVGTQGPVKRIHAGPEVTGMTDDLPGRYWPSEQLPPVAMGPDARSSRVGQREARISGVEEAASPRVAEARTRRHVNQGEESIDLRRRTHESSRRRGPADHGGYVTTEPDDRGLKMAASRHTADTMDETPNEGHQDPATQIMRHLEDMHGAPGIGAAILADQHFERKHGRPIHNGYGEDPGQGDMRGHVRWMNDQARSYTDLHEGLHLLHQHLHGHRPSELDTEHTWKYPMPAGTWTPSEGEHAGREQGFEHSHSPLDKLVAPKRQVGEWHDPTNKTYHYNASDSQVLQHPFRNPGEGLRDYDKISEGKYNNLHPERTDEYPNRQKHDDDGDDRWKWRGFGNLSSCPNCYSMDEKSEAADKSAKLEKTRPVKQEGESWEEHDKKYQRHRKRLENSGSLCPSCGVYKYMHATYRPSEVGRPTPHYQEEKRRAWDEQIKDKTAPFIPEKQHLSSRTAAELPWPSPTHCVNCGHKLEKPSGTAPMGNWPSKVPFMCNDCYIGHVGSPSEMGKLPSIDYEDKGGMGSRQVSERFAQAPLDNIHAPFRGPNPKETRWWTGDDALRHSLSMRRTAITGEEAEPGHDIWAVPHGESPVAAEVHHNMGTREPGQSGESWYHGVSYHGPYHMIRHPETRSTHVVDAQGRDASPHGGGYGNWQTNGTWGERSAERHWHGLESAGPDRDKIGTREEPKFAIQKERTPAFPHSRIDPEDMSRAQRPDARVHKPEGYSPEDEWHGPYEVVKHPETGKFHVVDNSGRHAPGMGSWRGHDTQMQSERSRDYIDKRQQSKERGAQLAKQLFEGFQEIIDPGGTPESRQSDRNLRTGEQMMTRFAGGRGKIKFDPDEEGGAPYYERHHYLPNGNQSGWYAKHYGGAKAEIYHQGTGDDVAHDLIRFPEHPDEREHPYELHPDFDDISFGHALKNWHDEEGGPRTYYERDKHGMQNEPRISRWKRRYPNGKMEPPSRPGGFMPQGSLQAEAVHYERPEDHPFFQQNPVDHANIIRTFHEATPDEHAQGMRWYSDAHHVARMMAHSTGHSTATAAGVLAAYSPQTNWPSNLFNASRALMDPENAPRPGTGAMTMHYNPARRILSGEHHSSVLSDETAPKTNDFAHLIEHGGDTPDDIKHGSQRVVIDRHALSVAVGHRLSKADGGKAPTDKRRYYEHVADKYRHAAKDLSEATGMDIQPHQVQAITWLVQQRKNAAEDEANVSSGGRGRRQNQRGSETRWNEHARQHHPGLRPGENMHVSTRQKTAYGETKVPAQVNTLRQEECPVCGESQVWTGQRCPVCGYVAPPDLFRDPDTSKAMQVREELDNTGDVDIPPEGQGSWPAADEQMYHPDQIAPNGVPGVAPAQPDDETQLEGEDDLGDEEPVLVCPVSGTEFSPEEGFAPGDPCPEDDGAVLEPAEPEEEDPEEAVAGQAEEAEDQGEGLPLGNDMGGPDDPEEAEAAEEAELAEDEAQDEEDEAEEEPPVRKRK